MKSSHIKLRQSLQDSPQIDRQERTKTLVPQGLKSKGSSITELQQLTGPVNAIAALSLPAVGKPAAKVEEQFLIAKFTHSHKASGTMNKQYHSHLKNLGV